MAEIVLQEKDFEQREALLISTIEDRYNSSVPNDIKEFISSKEYQKYNGFMISSTKSLQFDYVVTSETIENAQVSPKKGLGSVYIQDVVYLSEQEELSDLIPYTPFCTILVEMSGSLCYCPDAFYFKEGESTIFEYTYRGITPFAKDIEEFTEKITKSNKIYGGSFSAEKLKLLYEKDLPQSYVDFIDNGTYKEFHQASTRGVLGITMTGELVFDKIRTLQAIFRSLSNNDLSDKFIPFAELEYITEEEGDCIILDINSGAIYYMDNHGDRNFVADSIEALLETLKSKK